MRLKRACITAAGRDDQQLPLQRLVDRDAVAKRHPGVRFVMVGSGEDFETMNRLAAEHPAAREAARALEVEPSVDAFVHSVAAALGRPEVATTTGGQTGGAGSPSPSGR